MRLHSLKALGLAIGMSLGIGALVVAGQKPPAPGGKILVAIDGKASQTSVAKAVGKLGKVVEKDADSAFYVVQLEPGTKLNSALKKLRGVKGVRFALPESARQVNTASLPSVQGHIAYLKAKFDLAGGEEVEGREGETGVDFYEALEFFLADRVSGNGEIDGEHYARQIQHRNGMPEGFINSGVQQAMASNWSYMGPKNLDVPYRIYYGVKPLIGRVTSIVINPSDPNIMYVGGANGGVWKSTDAGVNWTPKSDREDFLQIGALAIDPVNPDTIYAGTGDFHGFNINRSQGILKSTNGGTTWTAIGEAQFGSTPVTAITVDPEDPNVVICTTSSRVWRSTNGGTSWSIAVDGNGTQLPTATWTDLTFSARGGIFANGPRTYWAVGSSNNVWKSVNRGATWTKVTTAPTGCVDVAASNRPGFNNAVYLLSTGSNKIWSSSDAGANWEDKTAGFPNGNSDVGSNYNWSQKTYDYHISSSYDPQNTGRGDILYVGLITIAASRDSGDTWVDLGLTYTGSAKTHNDQHSFAVHPTNPLIAFFGHDGGIFRCSYNPTTQSGTFTGLNADLGITQFYKMTVHPTNGSVMIGGTQDNASPAALGDLANWRNLPAGDGGFCDILNSNPSISYTTSQNLSVYRTSNNWATNANIDPSSNYGGDARLFIAPIVLHNSTDLLFAGTSRVWKYTGSTNTWTAISGHLNGSSLRDLETAPSHADTLYVGGTGGKVWRSTNITAASPTFTDVSTGSPSNLPNMSVTSIGVDPTQSADIIVGLVSGGGGQVWRCANTGASPRVWTNITGSGATGLPNVPVNAVARDPFDPNNTFFAGTDLGVFMTTDAGSTWTNVTEPRGLPNTMVNDLKVATDANTDNTYLYAATFGRGIWRIPLRRLEASTLSLPSTIVGGLSGTGYGYLNAYAPTGGVTATLSSNNSALNLPATVTIPAGSHYGSFTFTTDGVSVDTNVTGTLTYNGVSKTDVITITPATLSSVVVSPSTVRGGDTFTLSVVLNGKAPSGGRSVSTTDNSSAVSTPSSVFVGGQASSGSVTVSTAVVASSIQPTITATLNGVSRTRTFTLTNGGLSGLSISPNQVVGGSTSTGTVTISGAVGSPTAIPLSSNSSAVQVPTGVVIPAGSTSTNFGITTSLVAVTSTRYVSATLGNVTRSAAITLTPGLRTLTVSPNSVTGGTTTTGTVTLFGPAPATGTTVSLASSSSILAVPPSVTFAAGESSKTFAVTTSAVGASATRTISATLATRTLTAAVTVNPPVPTNLVLQPTAVTGGGTATGSVLIDGAAPAGYSVALSNDQPTVASHSSSLTFGTGARSASFGIRTARVTTSTNVTISATKGSVTQTAVLTVNP